MTAMTSYERHAIIWCKIAVKKKERKKRDKLSGNSRNPRFKEIKISLLDYSSSITQLFHPPFQTLHSLLDIEPAKHT